MKLAHTCLLMGATALALEALLPLASAGSDSGAGSPGDDVLVGAPRALLQLDGTPVDVKVGSGHAGPLVMDLDGEGPSDLLVGDLRGALHMYLGRKTEAGIRYESKGPMQLGGEDIRVHNW